GQNAWEEVDHVAAGAGRGANFGWSELEGSHPFDDGSNPQGAILPVYEYDHSNGRCAVIGGYVYRGTAVPALQGTYLFGDSCGGTIEGVRLGSDGRPSPVDIGLGVGGLSAFGQDVAGELYAASLDGTIVRIAGA
ncbi:MAG: sugar dehydrogenase, partial [Acidimicrobiales bacterium]